MIGQLLTAIFSITSDNDLENHISFRFQLNKDDNRRLKIKQPTLYKKMVEGEIVERFEIDIVKDIHNLKKLISESSSKKKEEKMLIQKRAKYDKTISLNKANGRITFSAMYVDAIAILLDREFQFKPSSISQNRPYLKLKDDIEVDLKLGGLKDSLVGLGVLDKNTKFKTLENIFKNSDSSSKVNWLGSSSQLSLFVKLLWEMKKIDINNYYKVSESLFLIDGKSISKLNAVKESDSPLFAKKHRVIIDKYFTKKPPVQKNSNIS